MPFSCSRRGIVVGDIAATELGAVYFEAFIKADDSDAVARADEPCDAAAADGSGASGDEYVHFLLSILRGCGG